MIKKASDNSLVIYLSQKNSYVNIFSCKNNFSMYIFNKEIMYGEKMSYVNGIKFVVIALIVVSIITYIGVISWQNKNYQIQIAELSKQIATADTMIDTQNSKIQELEINIEEKTQQYKIVEENIQKYKQEKLEYTKTLDNANCEDRMNYILQLQKEFYNGEK